MLITTPPLGVKKISVFAALFKAQLPDTLSTIRAALKDWTAVHVTVDPVGSLRRTLTKEEMCQEILNHLAPDAALLEPIYRLSTPEIPSNTVATFVPDVLKPTLAPDYQGWEYVPYRDGRARVVKIVERSIGAVPEGPVGVAAALSEAFNGSAVLEGWAGSIATPSFKRTMEGLIDPASTIVFWDTAFTFETTPAEFFEQADRVLHMPDIRHDRLYFDSAYGWFVIFHPGGRMRVGLLA